MLLVGTDTVDGIDDRQTCLLLADRLRRGSDPGRRVRCRRATREGDTCVVGSLHVTATNFTIFAGRNQMQKLQDPGLTVPGI